MMVIPEILRYMSLWISWLRLHNTFLIKVSTRYDITVGILIKTGVLRKNSEAATFTPRPHQIKPVNGLIETNQATCFRMFHLYGKNHGFFSRGHQSVLTAEVPFFPGRLLSTVVAYLHV